MGQRRAKEHPDRPAGGHDEGIVARAVGAAEGDALAAGDTGVVRGDAHAAERGSADRIADMAADDRAGLEIKVPIGRVVRPEDDVWRALEVRSAARDAGPPLRNKMPLRRQVHVDAVYARAEHEAVVAGRIGVRAAHSGAALRRPTDARPDEGIRHACAAGCADHPADHEALLESRVDAVLVRRCGDRRRRVEGGRVVVPLAEIARAGRRSAEEGERDLHVVARGNDHRVLPIEIGLRSAYELAAALCRVVRADVEADDWNGPRRVGDATVYQHA